MEFLGGFGAIVVLVACVFFAIISFFLPVFVYRIYQLNKDAKIQRDQMGRMLNHLSSQLDQVINQNQFMIDLKTGVNDHERIE